MKIRRKPEAVDAVRLEYGTIDNWGRPLPQWVNDAMKAGVLSYVFGKWTLRTTTGNQYAMPWSYLVRTSRGDLCFIETDAFSDIFEIEETPDQGSKGLE